MTTAGWVGVLSLGATAAPEVSAHHSAVFGSLRVTAAAVHGPAVAGAIPGYTEIFMQLTGPFPLTSQYSKMSSERRATSRGLSACDVAFACALYVRFSISAACQEHLNDINHKCRQVCLTADLVAGEAGSLRQQRRTPATWHAAEGAAAEGAAGDMLEARCAGRCSCGCPRARRPPDCREAAGAECGTRAMQCAAPGPQQCGAHAAGSGDPRWITCCEAWIS